MRKSWVVCALALSIICGIWLRSITTYGLLTLQIFAFVGVGSSIILWAYKKEQYRIDVRHRSRYFLFSVIALMPLGILLGWLRVESVLLTGIDEIPSPFTATIVREPDIRERNIRYHLDVEGVEGDVLLYSSHIPQYSFGDILQVTCNLEQPEVIENFDYPGFLAKDNIYNLCYRASSIEVLSHTSYSWYTPRGIIQRLITVRTHAKEIIDRSVPYPSASLISSLVLGLKQDLPKKIRESFSATGTSHIVAISGMHLMIISTIIMRFGYTLRLSRRQALVLSLGIIVLFISMIGFKVSALRAGIFVAVALSAEFLQRPKRMFVVVTVTALLLLLHNPLLLVHDVGFGLSFGAVLGILYISPHIEKRLKWIPEQLRLIKDVLSTTLAAQIAVTPLVMYTFGTVSITATLANLLIVPVILLLVGGGIFIVIVGLVSIKLASISGMFIDIIVQYVFIVVKTLATVPYASVGISISAFGMLSIYVAGFVVGVKPIRKYIIGLTTHLQHIVISRSNKRRILQFITPITDDIISYKDCLDHQNDKVQKKLRDPYQEVFSETIDLDTFDKEHQIKDRVNIKNIFEKILLVIKKQPKRILLLVGIVATGIWFSITIYSSTPQGVEIYMLDVGQGDSYLIRTPGNQTILIDGGPDSTVVQKLSKYSSINRTIDLMIITHPHEDHLTGLVEVLNRYTVDRVVGTGVLYNTSMYNEWLNVIEEKNITFDYAIAPRQYVFETDQGNVTLTLIYPVYNLVDTEYKDVNETSVVVLLEYQNKKVLFTGDIVVTNEQDILDSGVSIQADILKVPHHGSDTSSSIEFLEAVNPEYAVIPVGKDNDFGHPSLRVMKRLKRIGATIFRTDIDGDIFFEIGGNGLIYVEKR